MYARNILNTLAAGIVVLASIAVPASVMAQDSTAVLKPAEMQKLLPEAVFYRGQTATTQLRNSGGVKFADGFFVLTALVDTSGYSTSVAAKYQAYLITEVPIKIEGQTLAPGAYGIGFIADNKFAVTDLGAHDLFTVSSKSDSSLKRPMPLQVLANPGQGFRLYAGRQYVTFER